MESLVFYQLFEPDTSSYTYLLGDASTREAILIDPVREMVERDLTLVKELGLKLLYVLDTHVHADHITGSGAIRVRTGAKVAVGRAANVSRADLFLEEGQELRFGSGRVRVLETPGHTDGCLSYLAGDRVFTGDALLIRGNGRTDFQHGSPARLYRSIMEKLYVLPDEILVYPAHDYRGQTHSTIALEKRFNARIPAGQSEEAFVQIMRALKLAEPKRIAEAVPANLECGEP
jgi:glyoxylase-like metal-dependent hydrolase (beta-lactamase superfamily II)